MAIITDFCIFKYTKDIYYLDLYMSREITTVIIDALNERLGVGAITDDEYIAYIGLKKLLTVCLSNSDDSFVEVKLHKFYYTYIKMLYRYFANRSEYKLLRKVITHLDSLTFDDFDVLFSFDNMDNSMKISILSKISGVES